jgi:hypothetical protein
MAQLQSTAVTGSMNVSGSFEVFGTRVIGAPTYLSKDGSNVFNINLGSNTNFVLDGTGIWTLNVTVPSYAVAQSGAFIIKNSATTTPGALPANLKTPNGQSIAWETDSGDISVLSYLVVDTNTVVVNYIGNFG